MVINGRIFEELNITKDGELIASIKSKQSTTSIF